MPENRDFVTQILLKGPYWRIQFPHKAILRLIDVETVHQHTCGQPILQPLIMDFRNIDGIDYDALDYVARSMSEDPFHPVALIVESGAISEKYGKLLEQLIEPFHLLQIFTDLESAEHWLERFVSPGYTPIHLE